LVESTIFFELSQPVSGSAVGIASTSRTAWLGWVNNCFVHFFLEPIVWLSNTLVQLVAQTRPCCQLSIVCAGSGDSFTFSCASARSALPSLLRSWL